MRDDGSAARITAMRRFNRFYTQKIGVLHEGLLQSPFSLTESRVLYELAQRDGLTAAGLAKELALDPGYLSRLLKGFEAKGLLARMPSADDARQSILALTQAGRAAFAPLDEGSRREIGALLGGLGESAQRRLVAAMDEIAALLGERRATPEAYVLRPHRVGDIGWVVHRHAVLYAEEYGWDESFEALVAEVGAAFLRNFDPRRERCWIAEQDGAVVGSVFLVRKTEEVAKLRLLYVEPACRGRGLGGRLVDECLRFAQRAGYARVTLWTNSVLTAARALYEARGFALVASEPHHNFGHDLLGETWERTL